MRLIPLVNGKGAAMVDDADFASLSQHRWYSAPGTVSTYAIRATGPGGCTTIGMHRELLACPPGLDVDHINGNGLDNQRSNLRICSRTFHHAHRRKQSGYTSQYKGVCWDNNGSLVRHWRADIMQDHRAHCLGHFATELEAAQAYNNAARERFGEYARLNDLPSGDMP